MGSVVPLHWRSGVVARLFLILRLIGGQLLGFNAWTTIDKPMSGTSASVNQWGSYSYLLPVVQSVDVFVFLNRPILRDVHHPKLLALVDEWGPSLETEEDGQHLGAGLTVLLTRAGKTAHGAGLVMVLQVEGIPTIIGVHELLPFLDDLLQFGEGPVSRRKLALRPMIEIHTANEISDKNRRDVVALTAQSGRSCSAHRGQPSRF